MQLIIILLVAVSILTLLSGITVLSGARKGDRLQAFIFFFTTICSLLWAVSIGVFLGLPENTPADAISTCFFTIYISAAVMCWGLMSYTCHKYLLGKIAMVVFGIICAMLICLIIKDPSLMYSSIELSENFGNIVHIEKSWFYLIYGAYFCITVGLYMLGLLYTTYKAKSTNIKKANSMVFIGFSITGVIALIFDLILPYFGKYDTIWIGPLAMCVAWVFHYYAILRYHLINLSGRWLKYLSHIIIMSSAAIIYLTIFFIVFIAIFKVPSPSTAVIVLTSIMVIVVLLLFPVLSEISDYVRSLASVQDIDIVYIVKKLNLISKDYINYPELADFLAEHLHFQYIGIIVDKKLYGSCPIKISSEKITKIANSRTPARGVWLALDDAEKADLKSHGIEAVAILRGGNGEVVGKIMFGRPMGNITFANRDSRPIETTLTLIASAISAEKGLNS